jgi:hypothetical protein
MQAAVLQIISWLARIRSWFAEPRNVADLWLGKPCVIVAWLGLGLALACPPRGIEGIQLCWWQSATGIPCLGCGLTRSLSCGLRGMFAESWHYHPMGMLILALFLFTAIQSIMPGRWRSGLKSFLQARPRIFNVLYATFVLTFLTFGTSRALLCFFVN